MMDFHYSLPWWLVLVMLAGSALFLFQLRQMTVGGASRSRYMLLVVQLAAFAILVFQLMEPIVKRKKEIFHKPVILTAWDNSLSFQSGRLLRIQKTCIRLRDSLADYYRTRGFEFIDVVFNDTVKLIGEEAEFPPVFDSRDSLSLTDFPALYHFIQDSLKHKSVQAIFIFSDGWNNKNTDQFQNTAFPVPVFPIMPAIQHFNDRQLNAVTLTNTLPGEKGAGDKAPYRLSVNWLSRGRFLQNPQFQLSGEDALLFNSPLRVEDTSASGVFKTTESFFLTRASTRWKNSGKPVFGILVRDGKPDDNPFNDTLRLRDNSADRLPGILFLKNVNSLDEAWMIRTLTKLSSYKLRLLAPKKLTGFMADFQQGQLWLNSLSASQLEKKLANLRKRGNQLVIYGPQPLKFQHRPAFTPEKLLSFGSKANMTIASEVRRYFSSAGLELGDVTTLPAHLPEKRPGQTCLITVEEGKKKGCLLSRNKVDSISYFRFSLTGFWKKLFNPRESYLSKAKIQSLLQGTATLVNEFRDEIKVISPAALYNNVPFTILVRATSLPDSIRQVPELLLQQGEELITIPLNAKKYATQTIYWEAADITLRSGPCYAVIRHDSSIIWEDSLFVESGLRLEMSRSGFNLAGLQRLADESGGAVIKGDSATFPNLSGGQEKQTLVKKTRIADFQVFFFIVLFLMTVFWAMRKKMTLD